ncbi:hypothetical protein Ddye_028261 [Dipteronia dyeriana]|uniref:Reverse transcriptase zinc-binding domain-containing protein n=1 Tax=Dipteronia dyeriana TaxID=168575 RepID=A0AAD9TQV2_9ROSI|nr:hypothetical protein Ddye_028261 [Dipteronia dyeriana]
MKIHVNKSTIVRPALETPENKLWNSNLDLLVPTIHISTVHFYRQLHIEEDSKLCSGAVLSHGGEAEAEAGRKWKTGNPVLIKDFRWEWKGRAHTSYLVQAVQHLLEEGSMSSEILRDGLRVVFGNGVRANFWVDVWCDNTPLKAIFPRFFALASKKEGRVEDYGKWAGDRWIWEVPLRRKLFNWKTEQWKCFKSLLD